MSRNAEHQWTREVKIKKEKRSGRGEPKAEKRNVMERKTVVLLHRKIKESCLNMGDTQYDEQGSLSCKEASRCCRNLPRKEKKKEVS